MSEIANKTSSTPPVQGENKAKFLDFNRIKDKLIAIVVITLTILTVIVSVVIYQNSKTKGILDNISALRIPVPILTADIMSGANRVSASQRAYLMTGDDKYKQERLKVWQDQINPAAAELVRLKQYMKVEEHQLVVDETVSKLEFYENLQQEIDLFFETELKDLSLDASYTDSIHLAELASKVKLQAKLDAQLDGLVAGDASRARKDLRKIIRPLNQAQEDLLVQDNATVTGRIKATNTVMIMASLVGICLIISLSILLLRSLNKSIKRPTQLLTLMSDGHLPEEESSSKDELNDIFQATNLLSDNIRKASEFALEIGNGNFDQDFEAASEEDMLGNSLIQMRDRLREVAQGDKKRNWVTEGLAQFADILQSDISDMESFSRNIVSKLAKYTGANQGALFILNKEREEEYLELQGCYAWERIKYINKNVNKGEGLVGQVWLEGESIYLEEIPDSFVRISSGLGMANPTSIYLIPVKTDQAIVGVLELAFFHRLEAYKIEFIDKLCSNIAATITAVNINHKTRALLEQSQQQAEELRAQEEEMRQNMEELTATQEEMNRRDTEVLGQIEAMNNALATIEYDLEGRIISANSTLLQLLGYTKDEIVGRHHSVFINSTIESSFNDFWNDIVRGSTKTAEITIYDKDGNEVWFNSQYTPVFNNAREVIKVINFAQDITNKKLESIEFENMVKAIETRAGTIMLDTEGLIVDANEAFVKMMGYSRDELVGYHHRILLDGSYAVSEIYEKLWSELNRGKSIGGIIEYKNKLGKGVPLNVSYIPITDSQGHVYKVISFAHEASTEKKKITNSQLNEETD